MSKTLCPDTMVPLYQQLEDELRTQIEQGKYQPGDKIPSEDQLSRTYGISRITVRRALQHLVEDGVLAKKHGKGTFVSLPAYVESLNAGGSFTTTWAQAGAMPGTKLVSRAFMEADKKIAGKLGVGIGTRVLCIKRLRTVDGNPAIFEVDFFREEFNFLLHAQLEDASILELIRAHTGMVLKEFSDVFEIRSASPEHAMHLECGEGTPLLRVSQKVLTNDLSVMYFNEQYIRSDRYKYAVRSY